MDIASRLWEVRYELFVTVWQNVILNLLLLRHSQ
jgi:hypothetical protein